MPTHLYDLDDTLKAEFGQRMGRNVWLNVVSLDDLLEELAAALDQRAPAARAALWPRLVNVLGRSTGVSPERITPQTTLDALGVYAE